MDILGIDIGGSGIKGAIVDTDRGAVLTERFRIATPPGACPAAVCATVAEVAQHFRWQGPIGAGFPGVVQDGVIRTSSNVDDSWKGLHFPSLCFEHTGCTCTVINDADAAGLAEIHYGAGRSQAGTVLMITVGTGLGTALFRRGELVPNTELGHLHLADLGSAENWASDATRKQEELGRKAWAKRFAQVLDAYQALLWPDLIIIGGGMAKKWQRYAPLITCPVPIVAAALENQAGIVGAATVARLAADRATTE